MTSRSDVLISVSLLPGHTILAMSGVLDSWTYREVRDSVIKAALDGPSAVIVDVSDLSTPAVTAWTAFTSARWHVSTWPDVPVILLCSNPVERARIRRAGITRYVPVVADTAAAITEIDDGHRLRRRARTELDASPASLRAARRFTADCLSTWERGDLILTASTVVTVFVDNVLAHTLSRPVVLIEAAEGSVTVAVSDTDRRPAVRHELSEAGAHTVSGLAVVTALSRAWGSSPTADGKTVWALIGPENRL
jgi:hypothetical protein